MLLLVSGASGVGKSTARRHLRRILDERGVGERYETAELCTLGAVPEVPSIAWRQQQVEVAVRRAVDLEARGRHLVFAGDPVPVGEALAAPSADRIDIAACLLDLDDRSHVARLTGRGEPAELIPLHRSFAAWLRAHATDPGHVTEAVRNDAWREMRWDRWVDRAPGPEWSMTVLDTTDLTPEEVGTALATWCTRATTGDAPVFRAGWFEG